MSRQVADKDAELVRRFLEISIQVLGFAAVWGFRGLFLFARIVARTSARLVPAANSASNAVWYAVLCAVVWPGLGSVLGALAGRGPGVVVGLTLGGFVGAVVGYGVFAHGSANAAVVHGGVTVGEGVGAFGVRTPHVISRATRVRHVAVFGATGSGKSTVIKNLVAQDLRAPGKPGVMVVDIKDDLVLDVARRMPPERLEDVLLFDPTDTAFPPALNPFAGVPEGGRSLAAAELIAALKRLYAESWGPRLEHVLRNVALTLLEVPEATLLDIARLLTDSDYRTWALGHVTNFSVSEFWEREWPAIVGKNSSLANVESMLNKLSIFAYPEIRNVIGQTKRGIDFRRAMDQGQILLFNLPQGKLGEDASSFLASLVVGKAQLAAQSRVDLPPERRRPFYLFADEFQNYQTGAFDKLITEGRSMGIGVVAACQYEEQLPQPLRLTLAKNCAYALHCRLENDRHRIAVVKLQEPAAPDAVTLLRAMPPKQHGHDDELSTVREQARRTLGAPRAEAEAAIAARVRGVQHVSEAPTQEPAAQVSVNGHSVNRMSAHNVVRRYEEL